MLTSTQLAIVEHLFELDPLPGYPARAAGYVADMVGASGFRLELGEHVHTSGVQGSMRALHLELESGREKLGKLALYDVAEDQGELARYAARLLCRGVRYARRLDRATGARSYEDIQAMLERTPLTPRERDVVGRLLSGASTRQIAASTGLTVATVNTYLKRIFAKLGVHSRVELVARVTGTKGVIPSGASKSELPSPS